MLDDEILQLKKIFTQIDKDKTGLMPMNYKKQ